MSFNELRRMEDEFGAQATKERDRQMLQDTVDRINPNPSADFSSVDTVHGHVNQTPGVVTGPSKKHAGTEPNPEKPYVPNTRPQLSRWQAFKDRMIKLIDPNHTDRWGS